jgi:hydroxymethylpyrimidine pyrophosphatase-like HAD family hydrolase
VWDRRLGEGPVLAAERLADDRPWLRTATTLFGYRGDDIYYLSGWSQPRHVAELHGAWGEPEPIPAESFESLMSHPSPDSGGGGEGGADGSSRRPLLFHKLLLMDSDAARLASRVRPEVEAVAARHGCAVTQAVPTMVELLPPRSSKEEGVRELCRSLLGEHFSEGQGGGESGSRPTVDGLVAIGDAENDVGMLGAAAVGFAVGNAVPAARDAADVVLGETNDEGGAGAAIEMVLDLLDANAETAE